MLWPINVSNPSAPLLAALNPLGNGLESVVKGVLILAVLSVVAVVIGARQFGRAVA